MSLFIKQIKELMEQGKIYFDQENHKETEKLIIGCDFGNEKDELPTIRKGDKIGLLV